MRPVLRVVRAVAAAGAAAWLVVPVFVSSPASAADQTVTVGPGGDNRFDPATVTIDKGDTVTWQWASGARHTVTSTSSNWHKNTSLGPQDLTLTTTYTFTKDGTYTYHCTIHPAMTGRVIVGKPAPSPTPTHTPSRTPPPPSSTPPPSSPSQSASPDVTPTGTATPVLPSGSVAPPSGGPTTPPPQPTFVTQQPPGGTPFLGTGGLTAQPATGRGKGLPVMVALLLIGGVGSAELRALLANAPQI